MDPAYPPQPPQPTEFPASPGVPYPQGIPLEPIPHRNVGFEGLTDDIPGYPPAGGYMPQPQYGPTPVENIGVPPGVPPIGFEAPGPGVMVPDIPPDPPVYEYPADTEYDTANNVPQDDDDDAPATDANITMEPEGMRETMYFRDGKRRIDYVLAYEDSEDVKKVERKETFLTNLEEEGLELETEKKEKGKTYFVKVHAPWEVLTRMAELMSFKMPIKEYDLDYEEEAVKCSCIPNPTELPPELIAEEPDYFTADFNRDREKMFIIKDKDTFFSNSQRSMIVYELLLRTRFEEEKDKFGIDRLLRQGVFTAAYPLHEGKYSSIHSISTMGAENRRHLLYETWARPGRWYFMQPLDLIRSYFGEKIAIYFAWLGFYTQMLIPASVVGLIVFIYGIATLYSNPPSNEICNEGNKNEFIMCPLCDKRCPYWYLASSCNYSRFTYLFDNPATVFFAGFMAIWATMFLEFWKRRQAEIKYDWDVAGYELEEHMRPEFEAKVKTKKINPITQIEEPYLAWYAKIPRKCTSGVVILFMILLVLAAVFAVIMYRIIIVTLLYASGDNIIRQNAKITTSMTAALINLILIMLLNKLYTKIALWLTELERPRTDSDYEDSFTFKMYLFMFINYYSSIFYIALFKGRFRGHPSATEYYIVKNYRIEECDPAGCLAELCIQLVIVMGGKQFFNNFKEIMIPKIMNWIRMRGAKKAESEDNVYTRWEQDKDLTAFPEMGLFDEYLEMVIQYGFVTIFVAAFPLGPIFALINNIMEIRLDAYKFVTQWRRPVALRASDIGIWYGILQGITFIAVLNNAFIIGWTSEFIPKLVYQHTSGHGHLGGYINNSLAWFDVNDFQPQSIPDDPGIPNFNVTYCRYSDYRYPPDAGPELQYKYTKMYWHVFTARLAFIICFEHVVFFLTWLVSYLIPDMPARVRTLMLRELYLAKEARYDQAFAGVHEEKRDRQESAAKIA